MAKRKKAMIRGYNVDGSAMTEDDFLNELEEIQALANRYRTRAAYRTRLLEADRNGPPVRFQDSWTPASLIAEAEGYEAVVVEALKKGGF